MPACAYRKDWLKSSATVIHSSSSLTPGCSSQPLHWTWSVTSPFPTPWTFVSVTSTRMPPLKTFFPASGPGPAGCGPWSTVKGNSPPPGVMSGPES
jgi:hypothetical protein